VGVRVGVAYSRSKFALRARLRNRNLRSQFSILDSVTAIPTPPQLFPIP